MDQIFIRKAEINDLEQLYVFEQELIQTERPFDPTFKDGTIHYYDLKEMISAPHIELIVAESNHQIIGSGYARIERSKSFLKHEYHAYLGFMYVVPEFRGKGLNKRIIERLKDWARQQNIKELRLEVYYDNISAIKAYEKTGFSSHIIEMRLGL